MKRWKLALLACCLWTTGCAAELSNGSSAPSVDAPPSHAPQGGATNGQHGRSPSKTDNPPEYAPEDVDPRVVQAHADFAFDLFRSVANGEDPAENVFLSPLSAALALSMTMNGANGDTLSAMKSALRMEGIETEDINAAHRALVDVLEHSGDEVRIAIAGSLWTDEGLAFRPAFLETNETFYDAETAAVDLQSEVAVKRINDWVSERTEGKISRLLQEPLENDAILMLLNAIYFDANWASPFPEEQTKPHSFTTADGTVIQTPTMVRSDRLLYLKEDGAQGFQAVQLPYRGHDLAMIVFVPNEGTDLADFVDGLTAERWRKWLATFRDASGTIGLPRFRIEYETSLKETLGALGMGIAFDRNEADFTGMIELPANVFLEEVRQKTYVDVAEQGTIAAAVTGVEAGVASEPAEKFELYVDRPFFFAIHDRRTGSILFTGTVAKPGK